MVYHKKYMFDQKRHGSHDQASGSSGTPKNDAKPEQQNLIRVFSNAAVWRNDLVKMARKKSPKRLLLVNASTQTSPIRRSFSTNAPDKNLPDSLSSAAVTSLESIGVQELCDTAEKEPSINNNELTSHLDDLSLTSSPAAVSKSEESLPSSSQARNLQDNVYEIEGKQMETSSPDQTSLISGTCTASLSAEPPPESAASASSNVSLNMQPSAGSALVLSTEIEAQSSAGNESMSNQNASSSSLPLKDADQTSTNGKLVKVLTSSDAAEGVIVGVDDNPEMEPETNMDNCDGLEIETIQNSESSPPQGQKNGEMTKGIPNDIPDEVDDSLVRDEDYDNVQYNVNVDPYPCLMCSFSCDTEAKLSGHIIQNHEDIFNIRILNEDDESCVDIFPEDSPKEVHRSLRPVLKGFCCCVIGCDFRCTEHLSLVEHVENPTGRCRELRKLQNRPLDPNLTGTRRFKYFYCVHCPYKCKKTKSLFRHVMVKHPEIETNVLLSRKKQEKAKPGMSNVSEKSTQVGAGFSVSQEADRFSDTKSRKRKKQKMISDAKTNEPESKTRKLDQNLSLNGSQALEPHSASSIAHINQEDNEKPAADVVDLIDVDDFFGKTSESVIPHTEDETQRLDNSDSRDQCYKTIFAIIELLKNYGNILLHYFRH